jgi:hypothetical protein
MLARAAALLEAFETLTKMLIILSYVVHFDETTLRVGGKGTKQYVRTASTTLYTSYYLGDRSGASFQASGIGPSLHDSVIVHDRLDLYDRKTPAGVNHQLCGSHLVRDLDSAAGDYPGAHWPVQARRALLALNNAAHAARASGAGHIPAAILDKHTLDLRRAVRVGLAGIPRRPGPGAAPGSTPDGACWKSSVTASTTSCVTPVTCGFPSPIIRPLSDHPCVSTRVVSHDRTSRRAGSVSLRGSACRGAGKGRARQKMAAKRVVRQLGRSHNCLGR